MTIEEELTKAKADLADYEASFELRWKADQRAIARWQIAHPERSDVWPDHADLCVWLMEQVVKLQDTLKLLRTEELDMEPGVWGVRCIEDFNAIIDKVLKGTQ